MGFRRFVVFIVALATTSCGTALYQHTITVSVAGADRAQVGVFDHQQGYSRDWAHQSLGTTSPGAAYTTTITTTRAVTLKTAGEVRPFDLAVAIPSVSDEGYFLVRVDAEGENLQRAARFCSYGEYSPSPNARSIPVSVSARAEEGRWRVVLQFTAAAAGTNGPAATQRSPRELQPETASIRIDTQPVPLNAVDGGTTIGNFTYVGGLVLSSPDSDQLHGLSDLDVGTDGRVIAVTDLGHLLRAALVSDASGRPTGLDAATIEPLTDTDGSAITTKYEGDAEGLAVLGDGTLLVSFEGHHRISRYLPHDPRAQPAPWPEVPMEENGGMEALASDPAAGADAYIVGVETTGQLWSCRLSAPCRPLPRIEKPEEFGLVAIRRLPGGLTAVLLRAYDPQRGNRISLEIFRGTSLVDRLDLARPMTVDNFEAIAAQPRQGGFRFYLLSDDNASAQQRTLLLTFDWTPR